MRQFVICSLALLLFSAGTYSQPKTVFFNPGVKFGYRFGSGGGFSAGFEISVTTWEHGYHMGALASIDVCGKNTRFHIGVEGGQYIGISIGPTYSVTGDLHEFGFSSTIYGWVVVMPYFRLQWHPSVMMEHELGTFIKFPIQMSGGNIFH